MLRVSAYGPVVFTTGGFGCCPLTLWTTMGVAETTFSAAKAVLLPSFDSATAERSSAIAHRKRGPSGVAAGTTTGVLAGLDAPAARPATLRLARKVSPVVQVLSAEM